MWKGMIMMALLGLRDVKAVQDVRMQRAVRRKVATGVHAIDSFHKPESSDADVIEVTFGTACDTTRIGA